MRVAAAVLSALALAGLAPSSTRAKSEIPDFELRLAGRIGDLDARMTLSSSFGSLSAYLRVPPTVPSLSGVAAVTSFNGSLASDGAVELGASYDYDLVRRIPHGRNRPFAGSITGTLSGAPGTTFASDAPRLVGTWRSADGVEECEIDLELDTLPSTLLYRIETTGGDIKRPVLFDARGMRDREFARLVDRRIAPILATYRSMSKGEPADPTSNDVSSISIDYEVRLATPELVSVRFLASAWYVTYVRHDAAYEAGLTYDVRRRRELTLETEVRPGRSADLRDVVASVCAGTQWNRPFGARATFGGSDGWYASPHGLTLCFPVEQSDGSIGSVFVPWGFVRRALRPTSLLRRLADVRTEEAIR